MKKLALIISLTVALGVCAQKNMVFIELLGNGGFASLNYERQLTKQLGLSLRLGVGVSFLVAEEQEPCDSGNPYCGILNFPDDDVSIPFSIQYLTNLNNGNYLETGLGYTFQFGSKHPSGPELNESATNVYFTSLGFRRYFGKANVWMWKVNFTPILGITDSAAKKNGIDLWGGISLGRRL